MLKYKDHLEIKMTPFTFLIVSDSSVHIIPLNNSASENTLSWHHKFLLLPFQSPDSILVSNAHFSQSNFSIYKVKFYIFCCWISKTSKKHHDGFRMAFPVHFKCSNKVWLHCWKPHLQSSQKSLIWLRQHMPSHI